MAATMLIRFEEFERLEFGPGEVELLKGVVIRMPPPFNDSHGCQQGSLRTRFLPGVEIPFRSIGLRPVDAP
jgi:hypothetical protein